jgi:hypothetical protein
MSQYTHGFSQGPLSVESHQTRLGPFCLAMCSARGEMGELIGVEAGVVLFGVDRMEDRDVYCE